MPPESPTAKGCAALEGFLNRLDFVTQRVVLDCLLNTPGQCQKWNIDALLPLELQAFGHALREMPSVEEELRSLEMAEHDIAFLTQKLSFFETLSAAASHPMASGEAFESLRSMCEKYAQAFLEAWKKTLNELGADMLAEVQVFLDKYDPVAQCAETWQMQTVEAVLEWDNESDVSEAVNKLESSVHNLTKMVHSMKVISGHSSRNDTFKEVIDLAKKFHTDATNKAEAARKVATILSVAFMTVNFSIETKADALSAINDVYKAFQTSKEWLPAKMLKIVNDVFSEKPGGKRKSGEADAEGSATKKKKADAKKAAAPKKEATKVKKENKKDKDKDKQKK